MSDWISQLLPYVWAVPHFLVFMIGLVVAATNLSKYPRVAVLSGVAFLILLGTVFANVAFSVWVRHGGIEAAGSVEHVYFLFSLVIAAVDVVAYGMLVTAVFIDRPAKSPFQKGFPEMR